MGFCRHIPYIIKLFITCVSELTITKKNKDRVTARVNVTHNFLTYFHIYIG